MKAKDKLRLLEKVVGTIGLMEEFECKFCLHSPQKDDCLVRNGAEVSCLFKFDSRKGKKLLEAK